MFAHSSVNKIEDILCMAVPNNKILGYHGYKKCFNICTENVSEGVMIYYEK